MTFNKNGVKTITRMIRSLKQGIKETIKRIKDARDVLSINAGAIEKLDASFTKIDRSFVTLDRRVTIGF